MCGAVADDGEEFPVALRIRFACELHGVPRAGRGDNVNMQALFAQARERGAGKFGGFAATSSGIDNGEETVFSLFCRGHGH